MKQWCLFIGLLVLPLTAASTEIKAGPDTGAVGFAGEHAGMTFKGIFEKWSATLVLPPEANPTIEASFVLSSAKTGDSTYDSTLPEGDWFDVDNHPTGTFKSSSITLQNTAYLVAGNLTLRGVTRPVTFTLNDNGKALTAKFDIDRIAYSIGLESDPDAEWVSKDIAMTLLINK